MFRRDLTKDAELLALRHENAVLRRQVKRIRYEPADRVWFAALAQLIPRGRWAGILPVTPATRAVLIEYQAHCNTARPHQGIAQRVPGCEREVPRSTAANLDVQRIHRKPILNGLINEYNRAA